MVYPQLLFGDSVQIVQADSPVFWGDSTLSPLRFGVWAASWSRMLRTRSSVSSSHGRGCDRALSKWEPSAILGSTEQKCYFWQPVLFCVPTEKVGCIWWLLRDTWLALKMFTEKRAALSTGMNGGAVSVCKPPAHALPFLPALQGLETSSLWPAIYQVLPPCSQGCLQ